MGDTDRRFAVPAGSVLKTTKSKSNLVVATLLCAAMAPAASTAEAGSIVVTGDVWPAPFPDGDHLVINDNLTIGATDEGALIVEDGATIQADAMTIGSGMGATMIIRGAGSKIESNNADTMIGLAGPVAISITQGGQFITNAPSQTGLGAMVGFSPDSTTTLEVDGTGSLWSSNAIVRLGLYSDLHATVTNGGSISAWAILIGEQGHAVVDVSGAGSNLTGSLAIGSSGDGTVNIHDGGSILQAGSISLGQNGTGAAKGTLNVGGLPGEEARLGGIIDVGTITFSNTAGHGFININTLDQTIIRGTVNGRGAITQEAGYTIFAQNSSGFTGTTTILGGVLQFGNGGAVGNLSGAINTGTDATRKGQLIFDRTSTARQTNQISGTGSVIQRGSGTTIMSGASSYSGGTTITGGTLSIIAEQNLGAVSGGLTINGGFLQVTGTTMDTTARNIIWGVNGGGFDIGEAANKFTISQNLTDGGALTKRGAGTLVLSGQNTYRGGTAIEGGILAIGDDHALGDSSGGIRFNGGTLQIDGAEPLVTSRSLLINAGGGTLKTDQRLVLDGTISGAGLLTKTGQEQLILNGDSSAFTGRTNLLEGATLVRGTLGGTVDVGGGATLGGQGTVIGATTVQDGGVLAGAAGKTLTIAGNLDVQNGASVAVQLGATTNSTEMFHVGGDLALAGTLDVTTAQENMPGLYRIFGYDGQLDDQGFAIGSVDGGSNNGDWVIQTSVANQVNLFNTSGTVFGFWNGSTTAPNGSVNGGNGSWTGSTTNWTNEDGGLSGAWKDGAVAVFQGSGGQVQVDGNGGTFTAAGLVFMADQYHLGGDALSLQKVEGNNPVIQVGDFNLDSNAWSATIDNVLKGTDGLTKTGNGTLILTADGQYSGVTTVRAGTLQLGDNTYGGMIDTDVVLTATAAEKGTLAFDRKDPVEFSHQISGGGSVVQRGSGTTTFSGSNSFSGGLDVEAGTAKAGIADHAFGTGSVRIAGGATLDLADFNQTIGLLDGNKSGDGNITLGSATLTLDQDLHGDYSGVISGTGGLIKNGEGDLVLYGSNLYSGQTVVNAGSLVQGAQDGFSQSSTYSVSNAASLELGGFNTGMAGLTNQGTIRFGGTGGTQLHVTGDYVGNGGTLVMSSVLAGDQSSSDLLNISGNSTGNSKVSIINRGGLGAKTVEGIKIIDVGGVSTGLFTLNGDYTTKDGQQAIMTSSAYAYTLQQGSGSGNMDGNWYLVSQNTIPTDPTDPTDPSDPTNPANPSDPNNPSNPTGPRYSAAAPVYETYNATLQALNRLPSLKQRLGDRYRDGSGSQANIETTPAGIWGRIEGAHQRLQPGSTAGALNQDINTVILQAGVDGQFYESETGRVIAGITGQYGTGHSTVDNRTGDGSGAIDTKAWGLGATATFYSDRGFYLDAQAQANWYDSDLSLDALNRSLGQGSKGFGYALSLEAGQDLRLDDHWSLTPQAQLMWSSVDFDSFTDSYGARISDHDGDSLTARIGVAANYATAWKDDLGRSANASVYSIANLYQEFMGDTRINYAGTAMTTGNDQSWGGIGLGGSYGWNDGKYVVYSQGSVDTALNHFARSYVAKGNAGIRVNW